MDLELPKISDPPRRKKDLDTELDYRLEQLCEHLADLEELRKSLDARIHAVKREMQSIEVMRDPNLMKLRNERGAFLVSGRAAVLPEGLFERLFDEALIEGGSQIRATVIFDLLSAKMEPEVTRMPTTKSLQNKIRRSLRDLAKAGMIELDIEMSRGREKVYRAPKGKVSLSDLDREPDLNILEMEE